MARPVFSSARPSTAARRPAAKRAASVSRVLPLFIVKRTPLAEFSVLTGRSLNKKWEKTIAPVNESDVNSECLKDGGILAANDAAADDRQAFGNAVHLKKGVGVKSVNVVEGNLRRTMRLGAGGNEDDFSF